MKTVLAVAVGLLLLTLTQAKPKPESPPEPAPICFDGRRLYEAGESYKDSCNTCTCLKNGEFACTKMLCAPCSYVGPDGETALAYDGTSFNDGCNSCRCINGMAMCTMMWCPHKCAFTNKDGVSGWLAQGTVILRDAEEEDGAPQVCTCKSPEGRWVGSSLLECM